MGFLSLFHTVRKLESQSDPVFGTAYVRLSPVVQKLGGGGNNALFFYLQNNYVGQKTKSSEVFAVPFISDSPPQDGWEHALCLSESSLSWWQIDSVHVTDTLYLGQ